MASYGVYLAACGFSYHGPRGHIGFAPKLTPENFKCAFTSAEGWGSFSQKREARSVRCGLLLQWGRLKLNSISLQLAESAVAKNVRVKLNGRQVGSRHTQSETELLITLVETAELGASQRLEVDIR
jgi:hypothetical protein